MIFIFILILLFCSGAIIVDLSGMDTEAIVLMESETGKLLYEKNAYEKMYPASTTKILTALIALERGDLNDRITIGREVEMVPVDSSKAGHIPGDQIYLKDLLLGLMLPSGNDSAVAIANYIAKKETGDSNLSLEESFHYFAKLSNQRAKEIGAMQTHFINPHGYHDDGHYTTAYDLALIAREAMRNEVFREIVGTSSYTLENGQGTQKEFFWNNTNLLLDPTALETYYPYATGLKTGFTTPAGECLVGTATKNGIHLIAVLLNSPKNKRWNQAKDLFEYGFKKEEKRLEMVDAMNNMKKILDEYETTMDKSYINININKNKSQNNEEVLQEDEDNSPQNFRKLNKKIFNKDDVLIGIFLFLFLRVIVKQKKRKKGRR